MKKNLQEKDTLKPEVGDYYKDKHGNVFKVKSINDSMGYAVVHWVGKSFGRTWYYEIFPEPTVRKKLTSLEIELL